MLVLQLERMHNCERCRNMQLSTEYIMSHVRYHVVNGQPSDNHRFCIFDIASPPLFPFICF